MHEHTLLICTQAVYETSPWLAVVGGIDAVCECTGLADGCGS